MDGVGEPFGRLLVALGHSWAALERSLAPLGSLLGLSFALLDASGAPNAAQEVLGFDFSSILARFWFHFERVRRGFLSHSCRILTH